MKPTLNQQIQALQREEAALRKDETRIMKQRHMRQSEFDHQLHLLRAAIKTLQWMRLHQAVIQKAIIEAQSKRGEQS